MARRDPVTQTLFTTLIAVLIGIIAIFIGFLQPEGTRNRLENIPAIPVETTSQPQVVTGNQSLQQGQSLVLQPAAQVAPGNLDQQSMVAP